MTLERYRSIIPDWRGFEEAASRPEPTVFRVRTARIASDALAARLTRQGFRLRPLDGMPDFFQVEAQPRPVSLTLEHWLGMLYVQQASTGVAAPALWPRPGERVLDMCAAPGGKTTHVAELMEDRGCLVAADVSESRIRGLLGNVYRLGVTNVVTVAGDGRELPDEASFDRVLVDAPCTGEGTLRRRGGRPPHQSRSFLGYVTRAQEGLLRRAIRLTRPGGTILYVTCTFAPEENEAVVDRVLRDEPVELEPLALPVPHAPGLTAFEEQRFDPRLEGAARVYPHHLDSGGLFLARLRRLDGPPRRGSWDPVPLVFPDDRSEGDTSEGEAPAGDGSEGDGAGREAAEALLELGLGALRERFDVGPLDGMGWTLRGGRLWLHSVDAWPLASWSPGSWRPVSVGLRAIEFDTLGRPRPTNDLMRWLGDRIGASTYDLDEEALATLLQGQPLPPEEGDRGLLALRWRGEVLGRGVASETAVRSEIPKTRRKDLARIRDEETR